MRDPPTVRDDIALAKVASRAHGAGGEVARGGVQTGAPREADAPEAGLNVEAGATGIGSRRPGSDRR